MSDAVSSGAGPVAPCKPKPVSPECAKLAHAHDMAELSGHTYGNTAVPPGYKYLDPTNPADRAKLASINVSPDDLSPSGSQFRAQIFEKEGADPPGYVVAFKGTTPTSLEDWQNNAQQAFGFKSAYYEDATNLASKVQAGTTGDSVEFTGHSLGGGMASAASAVTGDPATTFNAAGLNPITVEQAGAGPAAFSSTGDNVTAYHVAGEILTGLQSHPYAALMSVPFLGPVLALAKLFRGNKMLPPAAGQSVILPAVPPPDASAFDKVNPVARHGMDWVIRGIEKDQKDHGCL